MRFSKLITSGCSFTYGQNLDSPEQAWPHQLAALLDVECVNLARNGASNAFITESIIDHAAENGTEDTVYAIGFSHWARFDFRRTDDGKMNFMNPNWINFTPWAKELYETFCHEEYLYKRYLNQIIMLQGWFKANDLPYIMFNSISNMHSGSYATEAHNLKLMRLIDRDRFLGFAGKSFDTWTDPKERLPCGHPNAVAHLQMARVLLNEITNRYPEE
jgi:hypothetical protein